MNTNELRFERAKLIEDARAILDRCKAEKRDATAEDNAHIKRLMEAADLKEQTYTQIEKLEAVEKHLGESRGRITSPAHAETATVSHDPKAHMRAFGKWVMDSEHRDYKEEKRDLVADNDASGGSFINNAQLNNELIRNVANTVSIANISRRFTLFGAKSLETPTYTGMSSPEWTSELGTVSKDTTASTGKRSFEPHLLKKRILMSKKFATLSRTPAETLAMDDMTKVYGEAEELAYCTGNGVNKPLGVYTASTLGISTSRDYSAGNSSTAVVGDNIIGATYQLKPQYLKNSSWLVSRPFGLQVRTLKDNTSGAYLWQPGLVNGEPDRLQNRPVYYSDYAPSTFTTGQYVYVLGDFSFYWIVDGEQGLEIQKLNELYAESGMIGFIAEKYIDAAPVLEEAFVRGKLG